MVLSAFPCGGDLRILEADLLVGHPIADAAVDFVEVPQGDDAAMLLHLADGLGSLDRPSQSRREDERDPSAAEMPCQGFGLGLSPGSEL